uniref:Coatomer subunit zeta n=1 Tax=Quercus lobata TaxID=97700 RepID=A0A7N2LPP7_QUELO
MIGYLSNIKLRMSIPEKKNILLNQENDQLFHLLLRNLINKFNGVPAEERLHWRSFLVKLGADNLKGVKNEELLVACHNIYVVGKDEYDELALSEVIFVITSAAKDVCGKPPTEHLFLDKYERICLCLDEIVWKGYL